MHFPRRYMKWLVVLAIVAIFTGGAVGYALRKAYPPSEFGFSIGKSKNNGILASPSSDDVKTIAKDGSVGSTLINLMPETADYRNGNFELVSLSRSIDTDIKLSGNFVRQGESFYTVLEVDEKLVRDKIDELSGIIKSNTDSASVRPDLKLYGGDEYQLDTFGLFTSLGLVQDKVILEFLRQGAEENDVHPKEIEKLDRCLSEFDSYYKKVKITIDDLETNYIASGNELIWEPDTKKLAGRLDIHRLASACSETLTSVGVTPERIKIPTFRFVAKQRGEVHELKLLVKERGSAEAFAESFVLRLKNINQIKPPSVNGIYVSLFDQYSSYTLTINQCRKLPVVASGFSRSYALPSDDSYTGPSLFSSEYFCHESDVTGGYKHQPS